MPRTDTENLVVQLEARIRDFERNFAKANRTASQNWQQIERRGERASRRIERGMAQATGGVTKFAGALRGLAAGFGVGFGVAGLQRLVTDSLAAADSIDKMSQQANVSTGFLQEMRFAASQSGVEARGLDDSIRRLNRRVGLFISEGGGPAAKALERLGIASRIASGELRGTEPIFNEAVRALQGIESQAERSALASQLFGEDFGPKLLPLLNQGIDGIEAYRQKARELGLVMDDQLIAKAVEANDVLDRMSFIIGTNLTVAVAQASPLIIDFTNEMIERFRTTVKEVQAIVDAVRELIHWLGGIPDTSLEAIAPPEVAERVRQMRRDAEAAAAAQAPGQPLEVDIHKAFPRPDTGGTPTDPMPGLRPSPARRDVLVEDFNTGFFDEEAERRLRQMAASAGELADETERAGMASDQMNAAMIAAETVSRQFAMTVADGLTDAVLGAETFQDAVKGIISELARAIVQALIFRAIMGVAGALFGGPGGAASGLFAGSFQHGGFIPRDKFGLVGERGPELISGPAQVTPLKDRPMQSINYAPTINVNVEGGSRGEDADRELAGRIGLEIEQALDARIGQQIRQQLKPGNLLNPYNRPV